MPKGIARLHSMLLFIMQRTGNQGVRNLKMIGKVVHDCVEECCTNAKMK